MKGRMRGNRHRTNQRMNRVAKTFQGLPLIEQIKKVFDRFEQSKSTLIVERRKLKRK